MYDHLVGKTFTDDSHPSEPVFTVTEIAEDEPIAEMDNGQWYELDGPEGLLAKLKSGVVRQIEA